MDNESFKAFSQTAASFWEKMFSQCWAPIELKTMTESTSSDKCLKVSRLIPSQLLTLIDFIADEKRVTREQIILAGALVSFLHLGKTNMLTLSLQSNDSIIVPITIKLNPNDFFYRIIDQLKESINETQSYQEFPFIQLATKKFGFSLIKPNLLTPILFNLYDGKGSDAPFKILLNNKQNDVELTIQTEKDIISEGYVQSLCSIIFTVLQTGLKNDKPISQIDLLIQNEINVQLCNGTGTSINPFIQYKRIDAAFAQQVLKNPTSLAISHRDISLSFIELDKLSEQLSQLLFKLNIKPGDIVAILVPRSISMVVSMLAVLKCGAIYMPIDPDYPSDRIHFLLEESQALILITCDKIKNYLSGKQINNLDLPDGRLFIQLNNPHPLPLATSIVEKAAYLMFTSGTTGRPKGVLNTHIGVLRLVGHIKSLGLTPNCKVAQMGATGFDASVFEIWVALLNGGCIQIIDREVLLDSNRLKDFFYRKKTDIALITTSLFSQLANDDPYLFTPLRFLFIGGDVIVPKSVAAVYAVCQNINIFNAYGPTENGVISTIQHIDSKNLNSISIGRPISNSTALVLNRFGRLMPSLFEGELYVGGIGLALGYLRSEKQTKNSFIDNPWKPDEKLYRTGDRARWNLQNELEFIGRNDFQIKIRGFRVELSEIENVALNFPLVNEAVVIALKPEGAIEYRLNCYLGVSEDFDLNAWHQNLTNKLPIHMVPSEIWTMSELPLTVHGKVDRKALIALKKKKVGGREPKDDTERILLKICRSLLHIDYLTIEDNLIEMGASSLTATMIASRLRRDLEISITISDILDSKTVGELAERLREKYKLGVEKINHSPIKPYIKATPQQIGLFVEQSKKINVCHYNLPIWIELPNKIDIEHLRLTFEKLILRHEILRTTFIREGDITFQHIQSTFPVIIKSLPETKNLDYAMANFVQPFDLEQGPLWRIATCKVSRKLYLLFDIHHILTDGYSLFQLFGEWEALYKGETLSKLPLQYRDYAFWLESDKGKAYLKKQESYWLEMYKEKVHSNDLPVDFPRSSLRSLNGKFLKFTLGETRTTQIRDITASYHISVYAFLLACYCVFLSRITGNEDMTIGTPAVGRLAPGCDEIQGMFANMLCLRLRPIASLFFDDFLKDVSNLINQAFDNQDYPFSQLVNQLKVDRNYGRSPLFDTMFALQNTGLSQRTFLEKPIVWMPSGTNSAIFDLVLQVEERETRLDAFWNYNSDLFTYSTLTSFRDQWLDIIDNVLANQRQKIQTLNQIKFSSSINLPEINFNF
jgi:amino acid adenylation domain-containing protein